ncbi:MAG: protoporphyrinogen oxidase HemJ [Pseudomonadota bacterium]|uniref:protoporphyrinogen oxidase HemJ n=1 Tax=Thermithiobacillus tepidarius TaxID=929 RepID=UPI0004197D89|nr:protoporphyrinogen oxidase HemJ [Thermithiobacillus tepidarius]
MLWVKAFHLIAVVTWFAGLFYLPRLFVYHAMSTDAACRDTYKVMERKLWRGITNPSMWVALGLGLWLLFGYAWQAYRSDGWLHAKLALVAVLIAYHFYLGHLVKVFRDDRNTRSHVFYRWINEFPVFILIAVVILVVVKPF